jgi:hypothetical protein
MVNLIHSYHKEAVFHKAFDICIDPYQSNYDLVSDLLKAISYVYCIINV